MLCVIFLNDPGPRSVRRIHGNSACARGGVRDHHNKGKSKHQETANTRLGHVCCLTLAHRHLLLQMYNCTHVRTLAHARGTAGTSASAAWPTVRRAAAAPRPFLCLGQPCTVAIQDASCSAASAAMGGDATFVRASCGRAATARTATARVVPLSSNRRKGERCCLGLDQSWTDSR